jgi:hypothetical protein
LPAATISGLVLSMLRTLRSPSRSAIAGGSMF